MPPDPASQNNQRVAQREPSDEYEDYDDQYLDTLPKTAVIEQKMQDTHIEDDEELPDTTMLDSVILPAIASVCPF
jgi:serine/threonine-protein kinase 24/25/MST4